MLLDANAAPAKMGQFGTMRSYPGGTQLSRQGESVADVFLILRGVIKLMWTDAEGRETIVGLRWPGSFLGAPSLIAAVPNPTSVVTLGPCTLEQISRERFLEMLRCDVPFAMRVHEVHSQEIVELMQDLAELGCIPATTRLENFFRKLLRSVADQVCLPDGRLRLPLKRKELAALIAISPEHLSRILRGMAAQGSIAVTDQWIIVRRPEALSNPRIRGQAHKADKTSA